MIRLILLALLIAVILAFKFLPWWALVLIAVVIVLGMKPFAKWVMWRMFLLPFKVKGAVLHDAEVKVHSIRRVTVPPEEVRRIAEERAEQDDDDGELDVSVLMPRDYFELDVTITPKPATGGFAFWEIGELMLELPQQDVFDSDDDTCEVVRLEVEQNGEFVPDEGFKLPGAQRLHLLLAVERGTEKLVFRYYFERFGEVVLPGGPVLTARN